MTREGVSKTALVTHVKTSAFPSNSPLYQTCTEELPTFQCKKEKQDFHNTIFILWTHYTYQQLSYPCLWERSSVETPGKLCAEFIWESCKIPLNFSFISACWHQWKGRNMLLPSPSLSSTSWSNLTLLSPLFMDEWHDLKRQKCILWIMVDLTLLCVYNSVMIVSISFFTFTVISPCGMKKLLCFLFFYNHLHRGGM